MELNQGLIEISIQSLTGSTIDFLVSSQETVLGIKVRIQRVEEIPASQQHLVWRGQELENKQSLEHYGIPSRAVIKLVLSLKGGPISTKRIQLDEPKMHEMVEYLAEVDDSVSSSSSSSSLLSDSNKTSAKKGVTVIVYQRGSRLSFYKVLDRGTVSPQTMSPDPKLVVPEKTASNLLSKYDELKKMRDRLNENGKTKSKMLVLKSQMKKLAAKKAKKRVKDVYEGPSQQASSSGGSKKESSSSGGSKKEVGSTDLPSLYSPPKSYLKYLNQKTLLHHINHKYVVTGIREATKSGGSDDVDGIDEGVGDCTRILKPLAVKTPPNEGGEIIKKNNLASLNVKPVLDYKNAFLNLNRCVDVSENHNKAEATSNKSATTFKNSLLKCYRPEKHDEILPPHLHSPADSIHSKPSLNHPSATKKSPLNHPSATKNETFLKPLPPVKTSSGRVDASTRASYLEGMEEEQWKGSGFYKHMRDCLLDFEGKDWDFIYRKMMMEDNLPLERDYLKDDDAISKKGALLDTVDDLPSKLPSLSQLSRKKSVSPQPDKYSKNVGKKVCRESSITELKVASQASTIETRTKERFFKNPYPVLPPIRISKQAIDTACEPVSSDSTLSSNLSDESSSPSFQSPAFQSPSLCRNFNTYTYRNLAKEYDLDDDDDEEDGDDSADDDEDDDDDDNNENDVNDVNDKTKSLKLPLTLLSPEIENYRSQIKRFFQDKLNDNFPLISNNFQDQRRESSNQTEASIKPSVLPSLQKSPSNDQSLPFKTPKVQASTTKSANIKRCFVCRKRTPLATSFVCRCEKNFCTIHRYPESHNCNYDYKFEGRKALKEKSPVVAALKLPKI